MTAPDGLEKVALLLNSLDPLAAEEIVARLSKEWQQRMRPLMRRPNKAPVAGRLLDQVIREFEDLLRTAEFSPLPEDVPRPDVEQKLSFVEAFERKAKAPPGNPPPPAPRAPPPPESEDANDGPDPLEELKQMSVDALADALVGEQPGTVSAVLNHLDDTKAGELLKRLPPTMRCEVSVKLTQSMAGSGELARRIARVITRRARGRAKSERRVDGNSKAERVAAMLRTLERPQRMEVVIALERHDQETAARVKELLYRFEDLALLEDRKLQQLLASIDMKTLAAALKGAPDEVTDKVSANLSKRARETLAEESELSGAVAPAAIEQARRVMIAALQQLDQAEDSVST